MSLQLSGAIKEIFEQIKYCTIATVSEDGQPWNTAVFSAYDKNSNLYWGSHTGAKHSQNIRANGKAFLIVYNSTVAAGTGLGVYIKAKCVELNDPAEVASAHALLQARRIIPYWKLDDVQVGSPVRLYRATPLRVWTNGEGRRDGVYIDIRTELTT